MKAYFLVLILCVCSFQVSLSQEDDGVVALNIPLRNSLTFNRFTINPTFSFVREQNKYISFSNKREWVQFENAPLTYLGSYSGRFGENIGAGLAVFQQNYGVLTTFGGILNFAYNVRLDRDSNLTFGLNVGAYKSGLNTGSVVTNFDDPSIENVPENFLLTVNPGINYGNGFFDFGLSLKNIVAYNLESSLMLEDNPEQGIQAHLMYTGYLDTRGFFDESKFSTLIKSEFKTDETIISALAMFTVPKGIWAQAGYNSVYGASGGLGINISPQIAIEYNFEKAIGDLTDFGPSHEITLAYRFKNTENYEYSGDDEISGLLSGKPKRRKKVTPSKPTVDREAIAEQKAKDKADADAKRLAEQEAREEAKANRLAEQKAKEEADANAKLLAEQEATDDTDANRLAEQKAKEEADANAKRLAEQKAKEEADANAKRLAEQKAKEEADANAKRLAEQKAKEEADANAKRLAEQKAKEEADANAKRLAEQKAKEEADANAKRLAEQKAKEEADANAKRLAEQKAKEEADANAKRLAEQKAKEEADASDKRLAEQKAKEEADANAKRLAEQKAKEEADANAKRLAEQKAKEEADANAKRLAEQKAKEEADANAKRLAEQKAKEEADANAKRLAEQKAKEEADANAKRLAEQKAKEEADANAKRLAEQKAKEEADANAIRLAEQKAKEEAEAEEIVVEEVQETPVVEFTDAVGQTIQAISKQTDATKKTQSDLLKRFNDIIDIKDNDLKDLKEENDLGEQGIVVKPRPFKSISAENKALNAIKLDLEKSIDDRNKQITALKKYYDDNSDGDLDNVDAYYNETMERLESEQKEAIDTKAKLEQKLADIKISTEYERRRRIKRAVFDNEDERYKQDRTALKNIKDFTIPSTTAPIASEFDFGEKQSDNIQILENVNKEESGYYLVLAVHKDINKRNDFLTKAVKAGLNDINFFYDVNTSKYYIYYQKFDYFPEAQNALKNKGNKAYNSNMSILNIKN
ncbi:PorP/SprF family type IX secretion system membrane protein [Olleya sp. HaHaR_3_96]|uniref:PorP/SprF family type IX secretion system membrane protein n=1 Tax=Olleya sp. HaHaR_3_96 TaxID=2745560 RepID=UPI001C4F07A7|nr:PorP/SprF family type IX secretion system membrane protein [Olleya sp. HaHaR_3_96]QXP58808.1 PorP/SprF family type IX secretion system membrane protein [Olleya sp. HaHaR_3_96]